MVFGMSWVVFIGAALLEREGRHLGFDLLIKHLPERQRQVLRVVIALGSAAVLSLVAWQSLAVVERLATLGQVSMAGGIPMRSEEHTSETPVTNAHLVCRLLLEKKKRN